MSNITTTEQHQENLVFRDKDGNPCTTSLKIAETFGKKHFHVIRLIKDLDCSDDFRASNFGLSSYTSDQGKDLPMYIITEDGFSFLVMGFTGKKAAQYKEEYIAEFRKMREQAPKALTMEETIALGYKAAMEKMEKLEQKIEQDAPKVGFYDQHANIEGLYNLQNAGKALGLKPNLFIRWLKQKYLFNRGQALMARVEYIQRGYFETKMTVIGEKERPQTLVTPKGLRHFDGLMDELRHLRFDGGKDVA